MNVQVLNGIGIAVYGYEVVNFEGFLNRNRCDATAYTITSIVHVPPKVSNQITLDLMHFK